MMFGATAMDSEGIGWIIAAGMVVAGGVISFAAYASERLEKERRAYRSSGKQAERRGNAHQRNKTRKTGQADP